MKHGVGSGRRFVVASLLFLLGALVKPTRCVGQESCGGAFGNRLEAPYPTTPQMAAEEEKKLQKDASDIETLMRLLDYYLCHWKEPEIQASRTRLILWTIQNHPDLHFIGGHDDRSLLINPDDEEAYAQARTLWLEQVERYRYFPDVLANAAHSLKLTDREDAAKWLISMDAYGRILLAEVYADAITGVTGENPRGEITSIDTAERGSAFAKRAFEDAGKDGKLAGLTGWDLHIISNAFRYQRVDTTDFDPLAELLLLKSVELHYPQPVEFSYLDAFYRSQTLKPADKQVLCKAKIVHAAPEEQAARLVSSPRVHFAGALLTEPGKVTVDIIVGVDGHVWEALARNASSEGARKMAEHAVGSYVYRPLKLDGHIVRVASSIDVTVEPPGVVD